MKANTFIISVALILFSSCNGHSTSQHTDKVFSEENSAIGDTVTGLCDTILVIYQDKANNYWFGSRGHGVFRYDGKNILHFTREDGLVSNDIWGIQEDTTGNIYFDTQDGVGKFDGQKFSTLTVSNTSDTAWRLEPADLWFKGNWNMNGPYRYDGKNLYHLKFPKNELEDEVGANAPNMTWSPYGIYSLYKDRKGNIWFGTSNLGIYRYDGKSLSRMYEKHLTEIEETNGSFGIRSIFEDTKGKYWFCNTRYRYQIDPVDSPVIGKKLIHYEREKGMDLTKARDGKDIIYYMSITQDDQQNLWMVTYGDGVWRYDGKNITHYPVKDGSKNITLFSIYKDHHGDLWLGTHEAGAYKFNGQAFEKFKR